MRRVMFILLICAALLACGAAFAEPGEAEVTVSDGLLSVTAHDAAIGNILSAISEKAGFELDINPAVSQKTVTTKFSDLEIQRGIERLLALVRQKDYFIYYKPDGGIRKLEVHGPSDSGSPAMQRSRSPRPNNFSPSSPRRLPPRPQIRHTPTLPNGRNTSHSAQPYTRRPTSVPQPGVGMPSMPVNPATPGSVHSPVYHRTPVVKTPEGTMIPPPPGQPDDMGSTPYIPPARMPAYIPPKN